MEKPDFQLINSLETFKDLFDNAHDLIHLVQLSGELIYVNHAWEKLLEYSQEDVQSKSIYDLIVEEDRKKFKEYRSAVIDGKIKNDEISFGLVTKSGKTVYVEGFLSVKMNNGTPLYTRGIFHDVSKKIEAERQLKLANEELKERKANLEKLLFHAPDAVIVIDENSRITYWNPKAEKIFGWAAAEAVGRDLTETIIPAKYHKAHKQGMSRYLTTGEGHILNKTIDLTALHKSGREFYISLTISTTKQQGKIAFIAFLRDIDQEKKTEIELENKRIELEVSNQELEQFAHVASHDMKEPVRKIRIFVDKVRKELMGILPENAKTDIDKIEVSALRLTKMIDGILAYSSLGAAHTVFETVNLNTVVENVAYDLEILIAQKQASITKDQLPHIDGAAILLNQLIYNLINNALKFAKENVSPSIHIGCRVIPAQECDAGSNNTCYEISIKDNGIGFEAKYAEKIFKTFSRLHSQSAYEGTGIGLALCKRIVDYHGGKIWAESSGDGAIFKFIIPQKQQDGKVKSETD